MRNPIPRIMLAFTVVLAGSVAAAQPPRRPPLEIGAGVSGVRVFDVDFLDPEAFGPSGDLRVTVPLTRRFSIEGTAMIASETNPFERRLRSLYSLQIRQRLLRASRERTDVFLTYGGLGSFAHVRSERALDPTFTELEPPIYPLIGVALQHRVARRLAVRADGQVFTVLYLPLGFRVAGGVSIPFGRYDAP